ncbi:MAG: ATP-binding protein [Candidatus Pseudobacter hemicellulosilyticus]|uniref:histidine kinase n=1 Tax=Candidatus Pseudobacter hemicellulosilyticus TaxID=3121375 RepID=A0AAJ6BDB7_9BACT|nr:MAG: ATP-binding protein [Pseudobacter sp.]
MKGVGLVHNLRQKEYGQQELQIKLEELNRSNMELEEFAYVASHDLQEPLRKLSTFGERLRNRCGDQLSEEGITYLNRMMASAESMRVLIDNLLEFSRVTRNQHPFTREDLGVLVKNVVDELDLSIEDTHASVLVDPLPVVEIMPLQIRQVFSNLISNALKFRRNDIVPEIRITASRLSSEEQEILKLRSSYPYYRITVADNGIGFEEIYAERIFQLFQRLHGKTEYPGSGIGLAICRKIMDNHQGLIMAESHTGQGASFSIILPEKQFS